MENIAILGAGGFGREVHLLLERINNIGKKFNFLGYFDDGIEKGKMINGYPVLGGLKELNDFHEPIAIAIALGDPGIKKRVIENISNKNVAFPTLIDPGVIIGDMTYNTIGKGCIICAGVIITVNIAIGDFVILNLSCTVGHDTVIGRYSSFMPTVNISGEVIIEDCVYVGTGVKIINQLTIGQNTIVGAGAVVSKSLPSNCTAVGVPAKVIKMH